MVGISHLSVHPLSLTFSNHIFVCFPGALPVQTYGFHGNVSWSLCHSLCTSLSAIDEDNWMYHGSHSPSPGLLNSRKISSLSPECRARDEKILKILNTQMSAAQWILIGSDRESASCWCLISGFSLYGKGRNTFHLPVPPCIDAMVWSRGFS